MSETFQLGLTLMCYGLGGVFTTLILFMLMIHGLTKLFPHKAEDDIDL